MAKSLRSKVKKRWRALRKNYLAEVKVKPELDQISKKLEATIVGVEYRQPESKNAFLHPEDPTAEFPQWAPKKNIDLRSTSIPNSGREYAGASRKHISTLPSVQQTPQNDMREQQAQENRIEDQTKHLRTTIKKDKHKKSKLRKTMVF